MAKRPSFYHHLHMPKIPAREARLRYTFGLGGISLLLFLVLLFTGILEMFYYIPSIEEANRSLQVIELRVPYGRLIRSLHFWAAQGLVITATLHLLRVVFTGAYKAPRRFNWLLGLILLVLVLLFDFTGFALRWDLDIAWAVMVGTNLLNSIPLIGSELYGIVVGGAEIGEQTVVRLYGWHIFGLTIFAIIFVSWHIFRIRRDGGISKSADKALIPKNIPRDDLVQREALAAVIVGIVLLIVAYLFPPSLGPVADFSSLPDEATAPWFFLWIQQLLRNGPPFLMGILIPAIILALLALVPYVIDPSEEGTAIWFNRTGRVAQVMVIALVLIVLGISLWGVFR